MTDTRITDVINCARCGENHKGLLFGLINNPIVDCDDIVWRWWVLCPTTKQPILLRDDIAEDARQHKLDAKQIIQDNGSDIATTP